MRKRTTLPKQLLVVLCILSILATPVAQVKALDLPGVVGVAKTYVGGNMGTVTSAVLKCKKVQGAIMKGLSSIAGFFGGVFTDIVNPDGTVDTTSTTNAITDAGTRKGAEAAADASLKTADVGMSTMTVPVNDRGTIATLKEAAKYGRTYSKQVEGTTEKVAAATGATANKLTCWQSIERAAAQVILKKLTEDTVKWINTGGFPKGSPQYIQDPHASLQGIADESIGNFTGTIGCVGKSGRDLTECKSTYPFGDTIAKELVAYTQTYFEDASRYSLNEALRAQYGGSTDIDFQTDFGVGGVDALLSMGLPNNNPFGFSLGARSELSYRLRDTYYSPALDLKDQLSRNRGFLDQKVCLDPTTDQNGDKMNGNDPRCRRSQVVTPGSTIATSLDKALGSPTDQLLVGSDITSDIAAIIDALLNHYMQKGLANM